MQFICVKEKKHDKVHLNKESLQMQLTLLMFFEKFGKICEVHEGVIKKSTYIQRVKVSEEKLTLAIVPNGVSGGYVKSKVEAERNFEDIL